MSGRTHRRGSRNRQTSPKRSGLGRPGYRAAVEPQMVKTGEAIALYYTDLVSSDGEIIVSPDVPELLPFTHYYRQVFGKPPSGIKYDALKAANMSSTNMTRLIMLPPNSPAEAVAT